MAASSSTPSINRWTWTPTYTKWWAITKAGVSLAFLALDIAGSAGGMIVIALWIYGDGPWQEKAAVYVIATLFAIALWTAAQAVFFEGGSGYDETRQAKMTHAGVLGKLVQKSPVGVMASSIHGTGLGLGIFCLIASPVSDMIIIYVSMAPGLHGDRTKTAALIGLSFAAGIVVFYFASRGVLRASHMWDHAKRTQAQDKLWEQEEAAAMVTATAAVKSGSVKP